MRSSRVDTFTLVTLGRLTLLSPRGDESQSLAKRRLKLALLAVLATAKRPLSRATLVEMFWGEQEESRARHSLSDALSHLRRELGRQAIACQGGGVWLSPDAPVVMDAAAFEDAVAARDLSRAAALYTGPFLDGAEIEAGPSFEQWASRERRRLEMLFFQVCAQQCLVHARAREWEQCGSLAARWLDAAPLSVDAALYRLNAVKAPGTREAAQQALTEFEQLGTRPAREFDLAPEKPVLQLAQSLRDTLNAFPSESIAVTIPVDPAAPDPLVVPNEPAAAAPPSGHVTVPVMRGAKLGRWLMRLATAGVGLVALVAALAARSRAADGSAPGRPRVAIALDVKDADSTTAWLADGLQMMASELSRSPDVEIVPPGQTRALLEAFQHFVRAMQAAQDGRTHAAYRELDAAVALDSGFVTVVHARLDSARACPRRTFGAPGGTRTGR